MDEKKLREAIRSEIKKTLKEKRSYLDRARSTVSNRLGRIENLAGVKLLKKAFIIELLKKGIKEWFNR